MAFKTTLRQKKHATFVAFSARAFAEKAGAIVLAKLNELLEEGETMPDVVVFQRLLGRYLEKRSQLLAEVDARYSEEQRIARALRLERQQQTAKVRDALRDARYLLDRRVGKTESSLHLKERDFARRDALSLVQLAHEAAVALRDPKVAWEPSALAGVETGSATLADALEREAGRLQQLSEEQEILQTRLKQAGLEEKAAELEKAKVAIRGGATLLAGLYTFADMPFHAQRVRLRSRKAVAEEEKPGGEETPTPPQGLATRQEEVIARLG